MYNAFVWNPLIIKEFQVDKVGSLISPEVHQPIKAESFL